MKRLLFSSAILLLAASSCKKPAGSGGNSQISGHVSMYEHTYARAEVTNITMVLGSDIKDGEYILINTVDGYPNYCIWFSSGGASAPSFPDRTKIKVNFSNGDNASTLAQAVKTALDLNASDSYNTSISGDLLTLTHLQEGEVIDGTNASTPIDIDVQTQGRNLELIGPGDAIAIDVYLTYGDNEVYDKDFTTDNNGNYMFTGLTKGSYTLHAITKDTVNISETIVSTTVEITDNLQNVDVDDLTVIL